MIAIHMRSGFEPRGVLTAFVGQRYINSRLLLAQGLTLAMLYQLNRTISWNTCLQIPDYYHYSSKGL